MTRFSSIIVARVVAVTVASSAGHAQTDQPKPVTLSLVAQAAAQVRAEYFAMDYIGGAADAERLLKRFPSSRELAAWHVANLARISKPRETEAAVAALMRNKGDPWGWFAQTMQLEYSTEGAGPAKVLEASLEAYRRAQKNPDIVWLRALALSGNGQSAHALALIDSASSRGPLSQEMRTLRASAMYSSAQRGLKSDQPTLDSAFALYAEARAADPTDVTAHTFAASRMLNSGRSAEGYALAKKGAELSPLSLVAHETYWRAIDGLKDRSQAARDSELFADVERLLHLRGDEPTVLLSAAGQYDTHRAAERSLALQDKLLAVAPATLSAEWVDVNRYRAVSRQMYDSTSHDTASYERALWTFIDRPTHVSNRLLGDAYRSLYFLADSTTNADTLLRIVRGMVKYEGINPHIAYAGGAIRLAERGRDFKEAEQIARDGLKAGKARIDEQKEIYETVGEYARAVDAMSANMYDALGVVFFRQNRLDDAQRELAHARELDPKNMNALLHLGQLSEARRQLDAAEAYYVKGALLSTIGTNPNRVALKRVYSATRGSLDGYDAYLDGIAEADRAMRKAQIAATRLETPPPLKPFRLKALDGKTVSLDSLRGKTTVINNWGMWCGPCVAEMPDFQKLSIQYASDSSVRILTIDNDPNTDALRAWMDKKGYTFTTLLDDGYLSRTGIHTYPTTWFVDPNGHVVFAKTGWSEKLVEEFGWRIDIIRHASSTP